MGRDTFVPAKVDKRVVPDVLGAIFADKGRPTMIAAASIRTDGGTQMRAGLDDATVFEYGQAMVAADGWGTFPPVIAYYDGSTYWLADGFHRVAAFLESFPDPKKTIPVDVRAGIQRDAILHAAGANAEHGLRRTPADKKRAVETMLRDDEWKGWSNSEIARRCNVSESFVRTLRPHFVSNEVTTERTYTTKHGTTATMQTANIGTARPAPKVVYMAPAEPAPAVLNTARPAPRVDDDDDEDRVTQPIVYTYEEMVKIAGDHLARGIAARKPDDEAIEHPLDSYEDPDFEAEWHDPGDGDIDFVAMAKQDAEILERIQWPARMRDLWELKDWFKQTKEQKLKEYQKLTGLEIPGVMVAGLDHLMRRLEEAMDAFQTELETNHVNQ